MVVQSADHGSISVRHSGGRDLRERVIDATYQIMDEAPRTLDRIGAWKRIDLTPPQREAFAAAALELKNNRAVTPARLLALRRPEDRQTDLRTLGGGYWARDRFVQMGKALCSEGTSPGGSPAFSRSAAKAASPPDWHQRAHQS
jgi:hypothetical protein